MSDGIEANDFDDVSTLDKAELNSRGRASAPYRTDPITSVTAATKTIVISGDFVWERDRPIESGDLITIVDGPAAGDYTVDNAQVTNSSFTVLEAPPADDLTGTSTLNSYHPPGCDQIGYFGVIPNATTICEAVNAAYTSASTTIPPMFISESPSSVPEIFGFRDQAYAPPRTIRLSGLFLYTRKTGGGSKDIRARIFKWDGVATTGYLAFIVRLDGVTGATAISDLSRVLQTAGADLIDPDLGDKVYGRIDDGSGLDTSDNTGSQPDPKFAQINYIPETGAV